MTLVFLLPFSQAQSQPSRSQPAPPAASYTYGFPQTPPYYHLLSFDERDLLREGEIPDFLILGGGAVGFLFGFGSGHAIQGRWSSAGWKFTLGEGLSWTGVFVGLGMSGSASSFRKDLGMSLGIASLISLGVFRIWEIIDTLAGPARHNRKVRAARKKAYGNSYTSSRYSLFVAPTSDTQGGVAGIRLSF